MTLEDGETVALSTPARGMPWPARVEVLQVNATPQTLRLTTGSCIVGAGRDAQLVIDDETVSRRHVELTLVPEGVLVTDLGSRNGTFYLGQRIGQLTLRLGSRVRLGKVELSIEPLHEALGGLKSEQEAYGPIIGRSPAMRRVFGVLERLEGALVTVLLEGESGTGKEVVARAIHDRSLVAKGPFVAVNCGSLDRALVRSELFGHARGSFTGATEARLGAFESASGGTLFLDEIGELPAEIQPVLLRALENGMVSRVGETNERPVKVRVVAATNQDLFGLCQKKAFREDLYYRLAVVKLTLPALRQRRDDIELLVYHIAGQLGIGELPDDVLQDLLSRDWPGNVRELKNALRAYAAIGSLSVSQREAPASTLQTSLLESIDLERPYAELKEELLETFLRLYVQKVLAHTGGNQSEAARVSGLERSYLSKVARRFGKADD